jgi:hypothetical protein
VSTATWTPDHTDAELNQTDAVDAISEAWPIGTQVETTWEGGEITHYSTDALIGYEPDWTETGFILAHKIRDEHGVLTRFIVLSSDSPYGNYQYVAIDATDDASQIAAYGMIDIRKV